MKICIAGASGLTGSLVLKYALRLEQVTKIMLPLRKRIELSNDKIEQITCDYTDERVISECLRDVDAVICCIGTTIKKAGSQDGFRKVDYEIPLKLARNAGSRTKTFILMSSVGANKHASNFYLKTKGEAEDAVEKNFGGKLFIARPSLLLGNRKESRPAERISILLSPFFNLFMQGPLKQYKAIEAEDVAKAMLYLSLHPETPKKISHYTELISAAAKL